jgi:hypothetical protein
LNLATNSLNFLVNEEVLPNPYDNSDKTTTPYLALKTKFLTNQQKQYQKELLEQEKILSQQRIKELYQSLLPTLLEFGKHNLGQLAKLNLRLNREYFGDKED